MDEETHQKAGGIQSKIDELKIKAQSASGKAKDEYNAAIDRLRKEKDMLMSKAASMKDRAKEKFKDLGM